MIAATVIRGFRLACGSWNTICIVGRSLRSFSCDSVPISCPSIRIEPSVMS
jgi:hypothetical protein